MIFQIDGEPMGKQRPKLARVGNFTRTYTPKETVNYENWVRMSYNSFGGEYFGGASIKVEIDARFPIPKSFNKTKHEQAVDGQLRPTKKPDCDNIAKIICDALNGIAYDDDKQIVELLVVKNYAEKPRVIVRIEKF